MSRAQSKSLLFLRSKKSERKLCPSALIKSMENKINGREWAGSEDSSGQNVADLFQTLVFAVKKRTALQSHMFKGRALNQANLWRRQTNFAIGYSIKIILNPWHGFFYWWLMWHMGQNECANKYGAEKNVQETVLFQTIPIKTLQLQNCFNPGLKQLKHTTAHLKELD